MRADLLLADFAQVADGKMTVVGAGWTFLRGPAPTSVAVMVEVPWDAANVKHSLKLVLEDEDGHPVLGPDGAPIEIPEAEFEVGRPPGTVPGTPLSFMAALNVSPMPLDAGRYSWVLFIDGHTEDNWRRSFSVLQPPMRLAG